MHRSGVTQWDRPFCSGAKTNHLDAERIAARDSTAGGFERFSGTAVAGVMLYDLFDFTHGVLDHIRGVQQRHALLFKHRGGSFTRGIVVHCAGRDGAASVWPGWSQEAVDTVEQLAQVDIDDAQAQLELGIALEEAYCAKHTCLDDSDESYERRVALAGAWNDLGCVACARCCGWEAGLSPCLPCWLAD